METPAAETQRIIRTGTIWVGSGALAPAIGLGPLIASGWRPFDLPLWAEIPFWIGAGAAALGLAFLVWAACPVLGFPLAQAHRQKVPSIRIGIVMNLSGMAICGLMLLVTPV
jgi:hypothetical protein